MTPAWLDRATMWCRQPVGKRIYNRASTRWPLPVTRGEVVGVTVPLVLLGLPGLALATVDPGRRVLVFWAAGLLLLAHHVWVVRDGGVPAYRFTYLMSVAWVAGVPVGLFLGGLARLGARLISQ